MPLPSGPHAVDAYWAKAAGDGGRELHYRQTKMGATLVARVGGKLPEAVASFRCVMPCSAGTSAGIGT